MNNLGFRIKHLAIKLAASNLKPSAIVKDIIERLSGMPIFTKFQDVVDEFMPEELQSQFTSGAERRIIHTVSSDINFYPRPMNDIPAAIAVCAYATQMLKAELLYEELIQRLRKSNCPDSVIANIGNKINWLICSTTNFSKRDNDYSYVMGYLSELLNKKNDLEEIGVVIKSILDLPNVTMHFNYVSSENPKKPLLMLRLVVPSIKVKLNTSNNAEVINEFEKLITEFANEMNLVVRNVRRPSVGDLTSYAGFKITAKGKDNGTTKQMRWYVVPPLDYNRSDKAQNRNQRLDAFVGSGRYGIDIMALFSTQRKVTFIVTARNSMCINNDFGGTLTKRVATATEAFDLVKKWFVESPI